MLFQNKTSKILGIGFFSALVAFSACESEPTPEPTNTDGLTLTEKLAKIETCRSTDSLNITCDSGNLIYQGNGCDFEKIVFEKAQSCEPNISFIQTTETSESEIVLPLQDITQLEEDGKPKVIFSEGEVSFQINVTSSLDLETYLNEGQAFEFDLYLNDSGLEILLDKMVFNPTLSKDRQFVFENTLPIASLQPYIGNESQSLDFVVKSHATISTDDFLTSLTLACVLNSDANYKIIGKGNCVDIKSNPYHCGALENQVPDLGNQECIESEIVCLNAAQEFCGTLAEGETQCRPSGDVIFQDDSKNCGACGITCAENGGCFEGECFEYEDRFAEENSVQFEKCTNVCAETGKTCLEGKINLTKNDSNSPLTCSEPHLVYFNNQDSCDSNFQLEISYQSFCQIKCPCI